MLNRRSLLKALAALPAMFGMKWWQAEDTEQWHYGEFTQDEALRVIAHPCRNTGQCTLKPRPIPAGEPLQAHVLAMGEYLGMKRECRCLWYLLDTPGDPPCMRSTG